jgi:transglutaminase-like putative cysteine protease
MLLKITHTTDLSYSDTITESVMELRVAPRQEQDQHRLSFDLAIGPRASVNSYFDWLANTVHAFTVNEPHDQIKIVSTSVVETDRQKVEPQRFADTWPITPGDTDYALFDFLNFGGPVCDAPALRDLVKVLGPERGMSLGELALRVIHLIAEKFRYEQGVTTSASPITELLDHGRGVCQDFTHLMIGLARALKIPARYVSGFVHPDRGKFRGYTQTHAWVELLFPSAGWIGFDPTNQCIVGPNFVKVAMGRDYRDVPPNKGVYRGNATESIRVQVKSDELKSVPPELAAERVLALTVPVARQVAQAGAGHQHAGLLSQQEQQQQ